MEIKPTEQDIITILEYMNINPVGDVDALAPYRKEAESIFYMAVRSSLTELLWRNIQLEINYLTTPPPSVKRHSHDGY